MPRFTGNAFKITPVHFFGNDKKLEKPEKILPLVKQRMYDIDQIPSAGWVPFQNIRSRESLNHEIPFQIFNLSEKQKIFPVTSIVDKVDTQLRSRISPTDYDKLPLKNKYYQKPIDFIFFNKDKKLFCLISASNPSTVDYTTKEFLLNHPFNDLGFSIDKNPNDFIISPDLILWLLYRSMEKGGEIDSKIFISDISLLDGQLIVPIKLKYEGQATTEYVTELKQSIFLKRTFNDVEMTIKTNGNLFKFKLFSNGCIEFTPSESEFNEEEKNEYLRNLGKSIEIYNNLIPALKMAYRSDKMWEPKEREAFRKKCACDCQIIINDVLGQ
ncbi:MAG TPA: hypothetical protein VMX17_05405 [Candidatus Glassbacteria bacterium]|nr:hypothetical protein [Candidatus Glassbacteria bacterium]